MTAGNKDNVDKVVQALKQAYLRPEETEVGVSWDNEVMRNIRNTAAEEEINFRFVWRFAWGGVLSSLVLSIYIITQGVSVDTQLADFILGRSATDVVTVEETLLL
jgi:hypothetical protein